MDARNLALGILTLARTKDYPSEQDIESCTALINSHVADKTKELREALEAYQEQNNLGNDAKSDLYKKAAAALSQVSKEESNEKR